MIQAQNAGGIIGCKLRQVLISAERSTDAKIQVLYFLLDTLLNSDFLSSLL